MRKTIDYVGKRFGFLTVIRFKEKRPPNAYYWYCGCDCGKTTVVAASNLRSGTTQSCGCGIKVSKQIKHRLSRTPIYRIWQAMKSRCYDRKYHAYKYYGGREIKVCNFLFDSPDNIISVIGGRPTAQHSIDRIDNHGNYSCGSCSRCKMNRWKLNIRWATREQQSRNRRNNRPITINGVTKLAVEWAEFSGITPTAIYHRINRGESGNDLIRPMRLRKKIIGQQATLLPE